MSVAVVDDRVLAVLSCHRVRLPRDDRPEVIPRRWGRSSRSPLAFIAGGASVKVVQSRLGHDTAVVTANTYSHLRPGDDELTRTVLDVAFRPLADTLRTETACPAYACRSEPSGASSAYSW